MADTQTYNIESSGLNSSNFFETIELHYSEDNQDNIGFSKKLILLKMVKEAYNCLNDKTLKTFMKEYKKGTLDINKKSYEELYNSVTNILYETATIYNWLYSPRIYNEDVATKCKLIPFVLKDKNVLSLGGFGMNLCPRLELYQFLTSDSFDDKSDLYQIIVEGKENLEQYFNDCTYKSAVEDVRNSLRFR